MAACTPPSSTSGCRRSRGYIRAPRWLIIAGLLAVAVEFETRGAPPQPSEDIKALLDQGKIVANDGDLEGGLELAERALKIARSRNDVPGIALSFRYKNEVFQFQGDLEKAMVMLHEAEKAWESIGAGPERLGMMASRAVLLQKTGNTAAMRDLVDRIVAIGREEESRPVEVAQTFNTFCSHLSRMALVDEAEKVAQVAVELTEKNPFATAPLAAALGQLGNVASTRGDLEGARAYHERALAIFERTFPGSVFVARTLGNLGLLAKDQGDLEGAQQILRRTLEIFERLDPDSRGVAMTLLNLGTIAQDRGDLEAATDYYERAADHSDSIVHAAALNNLGLIALDRGDLDAARYYLERGLAMQMERAPESLEVASGLHNLGRVAHDLGNLDESEDYHRRALELRQKIAPQSLEVALSLASLGRLALDNGDLDAAGDDYRRATEIQSRLAPQSTDLASSLNGLGLVASEKGDLEAARDSQLEAAAIQREHAPLSLRLASTLAILGDLARRQGDLTEALGLFQECWDLAREHSAAVVGDEARQAYGQRIWDRAADLIDLQLAMGKAGDAFRTLEEGKAQALLQQFTLRGLEVGPVDPELRETLARSRRAFNQLSGSLAKSVATEEEVGRTLSTLRSAGASSEEIQNKSKELADAQAERERLASEYTQHRVEMDHALAKLQASVSGTEVAPLPIARAKEALPEGALWIAFSVGLESTSVFLVSSNPDSRIEGYTIELGVDSLAETVSSMNRLVQESKGSGPESQEANKALQSASFELYRSIFTDEARQALESATRVMVSPDGPLWELPFGLLMIGPDRWLGLEKPLSYQPSLSVFARARSERPVSTAGVLIVGDPVYNRMKQPDASGDETALVRSERSYLYAGESPPPQLPGAAVEAKRLGGLYETEPLLGEEATEERVRAEMRSARTVHLATHGYFHPELPMRSGLLLTVPKQPDEDSTNADGALQAWEFMSDIRLDADLIVLSACETGRGQRVRGEGLVGLTRSLQVSGARSVLATRWKIEDRSAARLMVRFHRLLLEGAEKDEALRQAMEKVQAKDATTAPYFWAGFFLVGDVGGD